MILIYDSLGPFTTRALKDRAVGGADLHIVQIAEALTHRGYTVVVAKGAESRDWRLDGVRYVPASAACDFKPSAVILHRASRMPEGLKADRVVVHATDIYTHVMDAHARMLASGAATLVAVSGWLADQFTHAARRVVIPPMVDPVVPVSKQPGLFVFASAPWKGLDETSALWKRIDPPGARLLVLHPGYGRVEGVSLRPSDYRRAIAAAEGLFYVNVCPETFGTVAAMAERYKTRAHILAVDGACGLDEALTNKRLLTHSEERFVADFRAARETPDDPQWYASGPLEDLSPASLVSRWEAVLS